jgi:hypothetical protein
MNDEMTALMHKHLNSTLTPAEAATLANAMVENPGLADEFASLTRLDADLASAMKDGERAALYTRRMERAAEEAEPAAARKRWPVKTMAAAAGFAVLLGVGWSLVDGLGRTPGRKGRPGQPGTGGSAGFASTTGLSPEAESAAMKKKLRRFYVPVMTAKSQPVSVVLNHLQSRWRDASGKDDREAAAVTFALSDKLRQRWVKPEDEPAVSLEIPGISMLANLELAAAQAGLKPVITSQGVTMEEDTRPAGKERTWTIPLPKASLTAFMRKSAQEAARSFSFTRMAVGEIPSNAWWKQTGQTGAPERTALRSWIESTETDSKEWDVAKMLSAVKTEEPLTQTQELAKIQGSELVTLSTEASGTTSATVVQFLPDADAAAAPPNFITGAGIKPNSIETLIYSELAENDVKWDTSDFIQPAPEPQTLTFTPDGKAVTAWFFKDGVVKGSSAADPSAALVRLLAAHGIPEAGMTYDAESGMLTARGSMQNLRAANIAAAAIVESSSDGVSAEVKTIEWKDGLPSAGTATSGAAVWLTSAEVQALLKSPDTGVKNAGRASALIGNDLAIAPPSKETETAATANEAGPAVNLLSLSGTKRQPGDSISMKVEVAVPGAEGPQKQSVPVSMSGDGGWLRFDFPAAGERKAVTALVRLQSTTVDP